MVSGPTSSPSNATSTTLRSHRKSTFSRRCGPSTNLSFSVTTVAGDSVRGFYGVAFRYYFGFILKKGLSIKR